MKLVANWRDVLTHAWSVRFIALSILLSGVEFALPFLHGVLPVSPGVFALLSFLSCVAAAIARIIAQNNVRDE